MLPPIFFAEPESIKDDLVVLSKDEAHHAKTVLRLKENAQVIVINGEGTAYKGTLNGAGRQKEVTVSIHNTVRNFGEPFVKVTLAAGFSEGYKFDNVVQQGTEIGVTEFVPVITEKSKIKIGNAAKAATRIKRLERVALSAVKQCRRSYCPKVAAFAEFDDFIMTVGKSPLKLIFHPDPADNNFKFKAPTSDVREVVVLVGPESGFSDEEVAKATAAGFKPVRMGPRWMRTETAAPVACAIVLNYLGELS
jgi:16S rRNA (uracil1498-N3)-methyltransferase